MTLLPFFRTAIGRCSGSFRVRNLEASLDGGVNLKGKAFDVTS